MAGIDKLIINSAFHEPTAHWKNDIKSQSFVREPGRRPAGYFVVDKVRTNTMILADLLNYHWSIESAPESRHGVNRDTLVLLELLKLYLIIGTIKRLGSISFSFASSTLLKQ